jgi:hypothetical protein
MTDGFNYLPGSRLKAQGDEKADESGIPTTTPKDDFRLGDVASERYVMCCSFDTQGNVAGKRV